MEQSLEIIVETFRAQGENAASPVRVRPLAGQGLSTDLRVECSKSMRAQYPIRTLFRLDVKLIHRLGTPLLYAHHAAPFERVGLDEAYRFIDTMFGSANASK
jgi:hypothetical protein